jgi:hypothetical protein
MLAIKRDRSLALVVNRITDFYFINYYATGPPNRVMRYPYIKRRVLILSVNKALLKALKSKSSGILTNPK